MTVVLLEKVWTYPLMAAIYPFMAATDFNYGHNMLPSPLQTHVWFISKQLLYVQPFTGIEKPLVPV